MTDIFNQLDKTKCYCNVCIKNNIITELKEDLEREGYLLEPDCGHFKKGFHKLKFIENMNEWKATIGLRIDQPIKQKAIYHHVCGNPECCYEEDNYNPVNNWTCPKCNWRIGNIDYDNRKIFHKCINPECNYEEYNNSPVTNWTCPKCNTIILQINHLKCNNFKCNYEEDTICPASRWICPKCGDNSHISDKKHYCENCGNDWINKIADNMSTCPNCGYFKGMIVDHECPNCGTIITNNGSQFSCTVCGYSSVHNTYHNICNNCGYEEDSNCSISFWICPICHHGGQINHHICGNPDCKYEEDNKNPVNNWTCPKCGWKPDNYIPGYNIKYKLLFCKSCNDQTPHDKNDRNICLVCSGEYMWCEQCGCFGPIEKHSDPKHALYWAAETKMWINENSDIVTALEEEIIGFKDLIELTKSGKVCGVYGWFINDGPVYTGESMNILFRSYNHMMHIVEYSEYWYDIVDWLNCNKLEIRILETVDRNNPAYSAMSYDDFKRNVLKPLELEWIDRLKPDSQKCDGTTDHIRPVNERKLIINM